MRNREIDKAVLEEVQARIRRFMETDATELLSLPSESVEDLKVGGKSLKLWTFRDPLPDGENLIIVQCKNDRFLGYGVMLAEGIVVDENGRKRPAEQELMWEYV